MAGQGPTKEVPRVRFGVTMFSTDVSMPVTDLAVAAEERGFDSVWIPEHTHIPTSRRTPAPTGDAELAEEYKRSVDPLIALAAAASLTSTIRLGTGILLPAQREPLVTAKAIATLQNLSGGRFDLGIGFGWNEDEMEDHGVEYRTRREHTREHVLAMKALWEQEVASYDGEFVSFPDTWSWPKPDVPVPVLIGGGAGPKMFAHLAEYADGWIPIGGAGLTDAIPRYKEAVAAAGRDPEGMRIVPFGSLPTAPKLAHFAEIGVTECVFRIPSAPADEVLPVLDEQAELVTELKG
jgi:probable F420-dependent oxidoreductase